MRIVNWLTQFGGRTFVFGKGSCCPSYSTNPAMFLNSPIPPVTLSSTTTRLSLSTTTTRSASAIGTTSDKMEEDNDDDKKIPPLVLLGDRELMTPCEPCDLTLLQQPEQPGCKTSLPEQLEMLKQCQKAYGGIGIAACQVGWRTRIFCMGIDETDMAARTRYPNAPPFPYQIWINPTIEFLVDETKEEGGDDPNQESSAPEAIATAASNTTSTSWFWEGCLSVPGMRGWVERPNRIRIHGWNERGQEVDMILNGLPSRVAQHEYDHLNGILFPQRALPGTLVPVPAFANQDNWLDDWPSPGARRTKPGRFSIQK